MFVQACAGKGGGRAVRTCGGHRHTGKKEKEEGLLVACGCDPRHSRQRERVGCVAWSGEDGPDTTALGFLDQPNRQAHNVWVHRGHAEKWLQGAKRTGKGRRGFVLSRRQIIALEEGRQNARSAPAFNGRSFEMEVHKPSSFHLHSGSSFVCCSSFPLPCMRGGGHCAVHYSI